MTEGLRSWGVFSWGVVTVPSMGEIHVAATRKSKKEVD